MPDIVGGPITDSQSNPVQFAKNSSYMDHIISIVLSSAARDSGHPERTTKLRAGLALGKVTASGEYAQYDNSASDGTETMVGILTEEIDLLNPSTDTAQDSVGVMTTQGEFVESNVHGLDAAGKTDMAGAMTFYPDGKGI